jgi:hypothetical protein
MTSGAVSAAPASWLQLRPFDEALIYTYYTEADARRGHDETVWRCTWTMFSSPATSSRRMSIPANQTHSA